MGVGSSRLGHSLLINWDIAVAGTFDAVKKINDNVVWGLVAQVGRGFRRPIPNKKVYTDYVEAVMNLAKVLSSFKGNDLKRLKDAMGYYWDGRSAHSPTESECKDLALRIGRILGYGTRGDVVYEKFRREIFNPTRTLCDKLGLLSAKKEKEYGVFFHPLDVAFGIMGIVNMYDNLWREDN